MRETRNHIHEEEFEDVSPEQLFAILHTPSAIRTWWGATRAIVIPKTDGLWAAAWGNDEDEPDYVSAAIIREFDPPRRLIMADQRYTSRFEPLPFEADFVTTFEVETSERGGAILRVIQDGFPAGSEADAFYAACQKGWQDTFAQIRTYLGS